MRTSHSDAGQHALLRTISDCAREEVLVIAADIASNTERLADMLLAGEQDAVIYPTRTVSVDARPDPERGSEP